MPKLKKEQPKTLIEIVGFANKNGGLVPTARQLAEILGISERNASARIKRIIDAWPKDFVKKKGKRERKINYGSLVSEKETAALLLAIQEHLTDDGSISEAEFENLVASDNGEQYVVFLESLIKAGYLARKVVKKDSLRLTEKFYSHLDYLRLLAEKI